MTVDKKGIGFRMLAVSGAVLLIRRRKQALVLAVIMLSFYAGQLIFRLGYYGEWVSNSALAKLGFSWRRWRAIRVTNRTGSVQVLAGLIFPCNQLPKCRRPYSGIIGNFIITR